MKTIRIFISSPGDVLEERERAKDVVQSLRRRYARKFTLVPVIWEDLPLEPEMSFQQGIDLFLMNPGEMSPCSSFGHGLDHRLEPQSARRTDQQQRIMHYPFTTPQCEIYITRIPAL